MTESKNQRRPIQGKLLDYMHRHMGEQVFLDTMVKDLGETRERVASGMAHLINRSDLNGLTRVGNGIYVYRPNSKPAEQSKTLFELVGKTKDGGLIIEAEDHTLYRAVEL